MPNVPYQTYTRDQWQQIMTGAVQAHDQAAVQDAVAALHQYDQESVQATKLSSVPGELGAVGKGLWQGIVGIPGGLKALAGQVGRGDIGGAAQSIVGGLGQIGKNIAGAVEVGADALDPRNLSSTADYMPESERLQKIAGGASTLPGLGLAQAGASAAGSAIGRLGSKIAPVGGIPGRIGSLLQAAFGKPIAAGEDVATAGQAATEAAQAGGSGAAGTTPELTPMKGSPIAESGSQVGKPRGFTAEGPPAKPVTPAMEALSKYTQAPTDVLDQSLQQIGQTPQFEEGLPPMSPSRLIGPKASDTEIEALLKQMVSNQQGYR